MTIQSPSFGFPRMRHEAGERRDFLPETIALLDRLGAKIFLEHDYGVGMGFSKEYYQAVAPNVQFVSHEEAYRQAFVLVLRCPAEEELRLLRPSACLLSMLHYPTRPQRTEFIRSLGIEAISLDSLKDDVGRRLVENLRAVAWNGLEVAFRTLRTIYPHPGFESPHRDSIHATLLGTGAVGVHVLQAAIRYGDLNLWKEMIERQTPGVQVTAVDYDLTGRQDKMLPILEKTDLLIDATQRLDPSRPVIPNEWIAVMPKHAVLLDLSVDPYICDESAPSVKGIEGIPQGNLDQYVFAPDDPAYDSIPECFPKANRRYAISCYSWPGIHPKACMSIYGQQLRPILRVLFEKGLPSENGSDQRPAIRGKFFERAIQRALLSRWQP